LASNALLFIPIEHGRFSMLRTNELATCHLLVDLELAAPFWHYQRLYAGERYSFLLDSAKASDRLGKYSFVGGDPFLVYKAKRRLRAGKPAIADIEVTQRYDPSGRRLDHPFVQTREGDPFDDLRHVLGECQLEYDASDQLAVPLLAGAVGYFGYEAGHFVEELPDQAVDDLELPDIYLMLCDVLLAHCDRSDRSYMSVVGRGPTDEAARNHAMRQRDAMLARIAHFEGECAAKETLESDAQSPELTDVKVHSQFDLESYCRLVETCRQHIFAGDVFEICLTHRLDAPTIGDPWDLYRELRRINPAPFAAYLNFPEAQVISSSPERFLRLGPDRVAESRPIKGTRRRGATPADDDRIRREFSCSPKDRAENMMIVDLVRSDLGRVCKFGTIEVPELMVVESYATVFQLVSTIRGELEDDRDALDLLRAAFPGGSMTGAPKIEAMKIIDRLEPVKRGVYSGAIGYLDFAGTMDLSIAIRTFVATGGRCYFSVGGAIVADSVPRAEYHETLDKARALIAAIKSLNACR
jgi:para-aminobenzoate synthetase component 1